MISSRKTIGIAGALIFTVALFAAYNAHFVRRTLPDSNRRVDGFGRQLVEAPSFLRDRPGADRYWPGWRWLPVDTFVIFGGLIVGIKMYRHGFPKKGSSGDGESES